MEPQNIQPDGIYMYNCIIWMSLENKDAPHDGCQWHEFERSEAGSGDIMQGRHHQIWTWGNSKPGEIET